MTSHWRAPRPPHRGVLSGTGWFAVAVIVVALILGAAAFRPAAYGQSIADPAPTQPIHCPDVYLTNPLCSEVARPPATLLLSPNFVPGRPLAPPTYAATVVRVIDGDTVLVDVPAWASTPFERIKVRIAGIDSPETHKPPARCKAETVLGKASATYATAMVQPGDPVLLTYTGEDKYFRLDGSVTLPDGRDWATVMLQGGWARPYSGGRKASWCGR